MTSMAWPIEFMNRKPLAHRGAGLGRGLGAGLALAALLALAMPSTGLAQVGSGHAGGGGGVVGGGGIFGKGKGGNVLGGRGHSQRGFDARSLDPQERLFLQGALSLSGDYVGVLDGAWGPASQQALEDWSQRETGNPAPELEDLAPLVAALEQELQTDSWRVVHSTSRDTSYLFPDALLEPDPDSDGENWISADGAFGLMVSTGDMGEANDLHDYLLDEAVQDPAPYHAGGRDWLATSVELEDGTRVMARSEEARWGVETLVVLATDRYAPQMQLIMASYRRGELEDLAIPPGGMLAGLSANQGEAASDDDSGMVQPRLDPGDDTQGGQDGNPPPEGEATSSGTAFYVAPDVLVTAAHVVRGCREMRRIDGLPLEVKAEDDDLDLAVLTAPEASPDWLDMGTADLPRLGEPVTALGYPYLGNLGQGLTVTGGNVSALKGIDGGEGEIMISAPVQPGNSGGPLLNGAGAVIGVVVARVDDLAILEETGTLPQNMNFAVPSPVLSRYLAGAGVTLPPGHGDAGDLRGGIPDRIARSVVAVLCYGE